MNVPQNIIIRFDVTEAEGFLSCCPNSRQISLDLVYLFPFTYFLSPTVLCHGISEITRTLVTNVGRSIQDAARCVVALLRIVNTMLFG